MTAREIAFIACRIFSLYVLYQALFHSGILTINMTVSGGWGTGDARTHALSMFVLMLVLFLLFWFGADWFSRCVATPVGESKSSGSITAPEILDVGFRILGMSVLIGAITQGAYIYSYIWRVPEGFKHSVPIESQAKFFASLLLGLFLLFGAGRIVVFLGWLRRL